MDAIEAVVEVVKANEELTNTLEVYDEWFDSLVGKTVTITHASKKKTRFILAEVEEFEPGEGWLARDIETDEVFEVTFTDFAEGRAWITRVQERPEPRPKRRVKFSDEEIVDLE